MQPTVNEQRSTTKRGPGRPKLGKGVDRVLISIEKGLLKQADAFAKSKQMTRSEMVSRGLRLIMEARS